MSRYHTASYDGVAYIKTAKGWHKFLADKPVFDHISYSNIVKKLREKEKTGMTIRQCLGIDAHDRKHPGRSGTNPGKGSVVNGAQLPKFLLVSRLLNKMARRAILEAQH